MVEGCTETMTVRLDVHNAKGRWFKGTVLWETDTDAGACVRGELASEWVCVVPVAASVTVTAEQEGYVLASAEFSPDIGCGVQEGILVPEVAGEHFPTDRVYRPQEGSGRLSLCANGLGDVKDTDIIFDVLYTLDEDVVQVEVDDLDAEGALTLTQVSDTELVGIGGEVWELDPESQPYCVME